MMHLQPGPCPPPQVLAHAIVAQRVALSPAPTVAPSRLTGHGYFFMGPLHPHWVDVMASVQRMAAVAAAQLRGPTVAGAAALEAEVGGQERRPPCQGARLGLAGAVAPRQSAYGKGSQQHLWLLHTGLRIGGIAPQTNQAYPYSKHTTGSQPRRPDCMFRLSYWSSCACA